MDLRNIRTFLRVAELGSMTEAAQELNYAQSTVTAQIQQLEGELGITLFDRIGKRICLTGPGREFLGQANEILSVIQRAQTLGSKPEEMCGTLRVGVLESLLFSVIPEVLPAFRQQFPRVNVQLNMGQGAELQQQLRQNRLDLVYLSGNMNTDPDISCAYKRREALIFVAGPQHPAARQARSSAELFEYDFLVTERSGICYRRLNELASHHQRSIHHSLEVDSTVVIASLLKQGMGVALLPEYSVQEQLEQGDLVKLDVQMQPQYYYTQVLYHKSKWLSPLMERFIDLIRRSRPETE